MKKFIRLIINRRTLPYISITLVCILLVNILVYSYIKTENAIYYWDISAYWKNSIGLINIFNASFRDGVHSVLASLNQDYNLLPLVPLLPFLEILGTSRTIFILSILNLYLVPFAVILAYTSISLFKISGVKKKVTFYTSCLFTALFFPALLAPILDGRPDAISLLSMALIFLLYTKTNFTKYRHYVILGILICSMIVFRRYYSFWALGFFVSYAATIVLQRWIINNKKLDANLLEILKRPVYGLFISGLTIIAIMLVGFRDVFLRYITEDYSDLYSAYHFGSFSNQIVLFVHNFGIIFIVPLVIALIIVFRMNKDRTLKWLSVFIVLQSVIIFLTFTRTQTFGIHHYYMLTPIFIWSFYIIFGFTIKYKKNYIVQVGMVLLIIGALSVISFTGERSYTKDSVQQSFFGLTKSISPIKRHDIPELKSMAVYLKSIMKSSDYVYVIASSDTFNDDILRNVNLPDPIDINVSGAAHVDKRDGFPNYMFDAQYLIVADPPQIHLKPGSQDVIQYPAELILNNKALNLISLRKFVIDNGVSLTVYKKTGPYNIEFIESLRNHFKNKYPTYPTLNFIHVLESEY